MTRQLNPKTVQLTIAQQRKEYSHDSLNPEQYSCARQLSESLCIMKATFVFSGGTA